MEKIADLAKKINLTIENVLDLAKQAGLHKTSAEDTVDPEEEKKIRRAFLSSKKKPSTITKYTVGQDSTIVEKKSEKAVVFTKFSEEKIQNLNISDSKSQEPEIKETKPIKPEIKQDEKPKPTSEQHSDKSYIKEKPPVAAVKLETHTDKKKAKKGKKSKSQEDVLAEEEVIVIAPEDSEEEIKIISSNVQVMPTSITSSRKQADIVNLHRFNPHTNEIALVKVSGPMTLSELAKKMNIKATKLISILMKMGEMVKINSVIDLDTISLLIGEMPKFKLEIVEEDLEKDLFNSEKGTLTTRPPIVTIMGHVDHGKTTLLDYIRKANVAKGEAGGITQSIGAYHINNNGNIITFLDTPGHAAFTLMRSRGASCTDIVILVVAADDGVMPQTLEALEHAKLAKTSIIVAVTKIDKVSNKDEAVEKIKISLSNHGIVPDDWGGDVQFVSVSGNTGEGVDNLLNAINLQAELLDLKASIDSKPQGIILEAKMTKEFGVVVSLLLLDGTLKQSDTIYSSGQIGKIRMLRDENGKKINILTPSLPAEMMGFSELSEAGTKFIRVDDMTLAEKVAGLYKQKRQLSLATVSINKELDPFEALKKSADNKSINLLIKTDSIGSLEAIQKLIAELNEKNIDTNIKVSIVSSGVGGISSGDVLLAKASGASLIGFNVRAEKTAKDLATTEKIAISYHSVIYHLIDDLDAIINKSKAPVFKEKILGNAVVRDIFKSPKFGQIAGCMVTDGVIYKNKKIRVLRNDTVIYEGELESLRRFKEDVKEARAGLECGIGVKGYLDVKVGDVIEVFDIVEETI